MVHDIPLLWTHVQLPCIRNIGGGRKGERRACMHLELELRQLDGAVARA